MMPENGVLVGKFLENEDYEDYEIVMVIAKK